MLTKRGPWVGALLLGLGLILVLCPTTLADTGDEHKTAPGPDLSNVVLSADDLPAGFQLLLGQAVEDSAAVVEQLAALLTQVTQADLQYPVAYGYEDDYRSEVLANFFVSPLNSVEQVAIDRVLSSPDVIIDMLDEYLTDWDAALGAELLPGACAPGERCLALTTMMDVQPDPLRVEAVLMRHGPVLTVLWDMRTEGTGPGVDLARLSRLMDERLAETMGVGRSSYRPADVLVPEMTTYIPTPLDISTDPEVVGANLGLAALATILLTIAQELLNQTVADHEDDILRVLGRWRIFDRWTKREAPAPWSDERRSRLANVVRLIAIVLVYGLIFSLLERGWDPFTVTGVYLFVCMAIASGVVGLWDDVAELRTARRLQIPAGMDVRTGNLLLAAATAAASRLLSLVPGVWFGVPEAFEVDSAALDEPRERQLLLAGLRSLVRIALVVWLLTIVTTLSSSALSILSLAVGAVAMVARGVGGIQSLLLLIFASAVQNIFLEMVGLPDTVGGVLRQWKRWQWALGLLIAAFVYYHTLLNPQGDLANALQATSVRAFMFTVAAFTVVAVAAWLYFKRVPGGPVAAQRAEHREESD
jgi:hypothetical protein